MSLASLFSGVLVSAWGPLGANTTPFNDLLAPFCAPKRNPKQLKTAPKTDLPGLTGTHRDSAFSWDFLGLLLGSSGRLLGLSGRR